MGIVQIVILIVLILYILPLILCLVLIKNKNYKKLPSKKHYAGFWWRFLAGFIDNLILAIVSTGISFLLIYQPYISAALNILIYWLYFVLFQTSKERSTLGMKACGIKIHDEHFNRVSFWRLTGRYCVTSLSAIILFIGFFMIGFTQRKQGLHDLITRTIHTKD
mgnify:CR=1 FL=1|tara:strand:- start:1224 stop:1715 length:492 start_codon:yes stop_codon:yes gene_type:complete